MENNTPLHSIVSIRKALNLVESKKEILREKYEELQSNSSVLAPLSFTWEDIESYILSIESDLQEKFAVIQEQESSKKRQPRIFKRFSSEQIPARQEMITLCESMDGIGLCKYVLDRPKERTPIRVELVDALRHAPDPHSLILGALTGFCEGVTDPSLGHDQVGIRRVCVVLLEELLRIEVEIGEEVKHRAKVIAVLWMEKPTFADGNDGDGGEDEERKEEIGALQKLGFLLILSAYKLASDGSYNVDELISYIAEIAKYRQAVELCQMVGLESRVPDIVEKLILKDKQLWALKFIFEFDLTEEFPPVPILKSYAMNAERLVRKIHKGGKGSSQPMNKVSVINALKAVVKCIEDHNLDSEYPKSSVLRRIERLEMEISDRKRKSSAPPNPHRQFKRPFVHKKRRMRSSADPRASKRRVPGRSSAPRQSQPSSIQLAGLSHDLTAPYLGASAAPYGGLAGSYVAAAPPYASSASGLYGLPGAAPQTGSSSYHPEPPAQHVQPGYYEGAVGYGGYNLPAQYHPVYYPQ